MLAKIIYNMGARLRNPSLYQSYAELKSSEWLPREKLLEIQLENCRSLLQFANDYSPYYQKLFQEIDFKPDSLISIGELSRIPSINKPTLIKCNSEIHTQYPFRKLFLAETSGTSGQALEFTKDEQWDSINRASLMRAYDWYDIKPWDRNGYLWGYNIDPKEKIKVKFLDMLQNRFRIFSYESSEIDQFSKKLEGAKFLNGYSSMIYEVAKKINTKKNSIESKKTTLKLVKGTSETILDIYKQECEKAFGVKLRSEYGAAESGLIAFECPHGSMHINIENVVVEVENDEIIVTNLVSRSFPIIRYKLGDQIKIDDKRICSCGRQHPIITDVLGRKGAKVMGKTKEYPSLTFYYIFKNIAIKNDLKLNYHARQEAKGEILLFIEQEKDANIEQFLWKEIKSYFDDDIEFFITFGELPGAKGSKSQYFVSTID